MIDHYAIVEEDKITEPPLYLIHLSPRLGLFAISEVFCFHALQLDLLACWWVLDLDCKHLCLYFQKILRTVLGNLYQAR